jgi:RES domain-containing protein
MNVYRITRAKYQHDLMGTGARLNGGRWNPIGISLLYTADSRALAAMELAIRMDLGDLMDDLVILKINLSLGRRKKLLQEINSEDLPQGWDAYPNKEEAHPVGKQFCEDGKYIALKVPSPYIQGDYNYLINSYHPLFQKNVKTTDIKPFSFDQKILINFS